MMAHIVYTAENYDAQRDAFINDLPDNIKNQLYKIMYQDYKIKVQFFR